MPRSRRLIKSQTCYELCFRARDSLPLVANRIMRLVIASSLARAQRDDKVVLCHDVWNGSHVHMLLIAQDPYECTKFYMEVEKKITETIKRLLGLSHRRIWEGRATLTEVADVDAAIGRIAYFYGNPAKDNLEDSIEKFPGYSSWREFQASRAVIDAEPTANYPWLRQPSVPRLVSAAPTPAQESGVVQLLLKRNKSVKHPLKRRPNAWMRCFGITSDRDAAEINSKIVERLRVIEENARIERKQQGKSVMGARVLCRQSILKPHTPKKHERKVFVVSTINELRMQRIREHKDFSEECAWCYEQWRLGNLSVDWPPGAFKPPLPPSCCVLPE